ncbi:MAG TPA: VOC family protein [Bacteroidales bacterium]|nr:VOC family protein [Bacteroidales bacterium]
MIVQFHSSVLFVKNMEKSRAFYCDILKQEIETDFGNNIMLKGGLSIWEIQESHELHRTFYKKDVSNSSMELYFETENMNKVIELIHQFNIPKHHELVEESWGQRTIRIYDPDRNLVEIGEKLEVFIQRMYKEGMSIEEIMKKTGVPKPMIEKSVIW